MDIAIQFDKINLDDEKCIFKPITIIRGEHHKEDNYFVNDADIPCVPIDGGYLDQTDFFGLVTNIEELKDAYGKNLPEATLLSNYFDMAVENIYIGMYQPDETVKLMVLPIYAIEEGLEKYSEQQEFAGEEESMVSFDFESLTNLRNSKSLEEVQDKLDVFIRILEGLKIDDQVLTEKDIETLTGKKKTKKMSLDKDGSKRFDLIKLRKEVLSKIISQDEAVKSVTTTIAVNQQSNNPMHKSHILIAGPSGTGKSEMINVISKYLDIPYFKADATAYTKEGYVGKSVYSMLNGLVDAADGDIEKAQNGILIIDEIDKSALGSNDDVNGQAVLYSLLKIMDRDVVEMNNGFSKSTRFDTSNLTIIFMGAFEEMFAKKRNTKNKKIGFSDNSTTNENMTITNQDFIDFGMPAEFMGRIGELTYTKELKEKDLLRILRKSKISPIKSEKEYFKDLGIQVHFTDGYLKEVVSRSIKSRTGARDLKKIVHQSLVEAYELSFVNPKVKSMKFTKETVKDPKKYYAE